MPARRPPSETAASLHRWPRVALLVLVAAAAECGRGKGSAEPSSGSAAGQGSLAGGRADDTVPPEDGQWPMVGKDYQNRRFSGLADINIGNVAQLKVAWSLSTGIPKGHEA